MIGPVAEELFYAGVFEGLEKGAVFTPHQWAAMHGRNLKANLLARSGLQRMGGTAASPVGGTPPLPPAPAGPSAPPSVSRGAAATSKGGRA